MNKDNFKFTKSAQFYKKTKKISKKSIRELFISLSEHKLGNYVFNCIKEEVTGLNLTYSLMSFKYQEEPVFLENSTELEIKYAVILLIEYCDYLAIIKKNISDESLQEVLGYSDLDLEYFLHFKAKNSPTYNGLRAKSMNMSKDGIHTRSYGSIGAIDHSLSLLTTSRSILNGFKLDDGTKWSVTPNTSRIIEHGVSIDLDNILEWVITVCGEFSTSHISPFIGSFAKRVALQDIVKKEKNTAIAIFIDLSELYVLILDQTVELSINGKKFSSIEYERLFYFFRSIKKLKNNLYRNLGYIKINTNTITIASRHLDSIVVNVQGKSLTLTQYINRSKIIQIIFDNPLYSYYANSCYRDESILNIATTLPMLLNDTENFSKVLTEKETDKISISSTNFPDTSLFKHVEDRYSEKDAIIICDDLGDEWADHIIFKKEAMYYIHEKFEDKTSLGASKFHEVVSQAIKNLVHINATKSEYLKKYDDKWSKCYSNSLIKRFSACGQSFNSSIDEKKYLDEMLQVLFSNPNTIKKIILVTPFLSKLDLENEMNKVKNTQKVSAHIYQLLWLLSSFIGMCKEQGVQAEILCSA